MGISTLQPRCILTIIAMAAMVGAVWAPATAQGGSADLGKARAVWASADLRDQAVACADICGKALLAYEQALGVEGPDQVVVEVHGPPATGFPNTSASPPDTVYVNASGWGIGQQYRPHAGPVGLLCESVAELLGLDEVPGFAYYAAHVHGVAAVCADAPPLWGGTPYTVANEGQSMLAGLRANTAFLEQHPNWAAASLLWRLEDKGGEAGALCRALAESDGSGHDRLVSVAGLPQYADDAVTGALTAYLTARKPLLDSPQAVTISSFESPADLAKWQKWGLDVVRTQEDVAEGEWAAEISYPAKQDGYVTLCLMDPDWYVADWSGYRYLSAYVHNPMPYLIGLLVEAFDAPDRGRCVARCQTSITGGYQGPWVVPLERLWQRADLYEDSLLPPTGFDTHRVSQLCLTIPQPLVAGKLRVDALQLQRGGAGGAE